MKYLLVYGNPVDGFNFSGPFDSQQDAIDHGNSSDMGDQPWWVSELSALINSQE
jgi:hypothetical protein